MNDSRPGRSETLLVIPLYNHGTTVREVVVKGLATGMDVVVVDDGSTDGGADSLADLDCELLRHSVNRGKGQAILTGARLAAQRGYSSILTLDADGQHDPADAPLLLAAAEAQNGPVVVLGVRKMVQQTVPGSSRFGRSFSNFWVRLETGVELQDTQSGLRLYPVKSLLELRCATRGYAFEIEALVRLIWAGVAVREVPVSVHYPPPDERVSHFDKLWDNLRLSLLHARLVILRLLPIRQKRVAAGAKVEPVLVAGNPLKTLKNLCREHSSPLLLATAVWLGLFLGALPLLACHTLVIIWVSYRLHLNKVAAVAASQFCMPPLVPALCIEVGYFLRNGEFIVDPSWQRWVLEVHHRLYDWFLGSLLVGPLLGFVGGGLVWWWAGRLGRIRARLS